MWLLQAALIALLSALCFLTRIYWRLKHPRFGNDTWYHLAAARAIRRGRGRIPRRIGLHFNDGDWDYPPFLSCLLSLSGPERALKLSAIVPALFDTLSCAAVGAFLAYLPSSGLLELGCPWTPPFGLDGAGALSLLLPLLGMLVWTLTPMTCIDAFQHLSPRPVANFWMVLTLLLMLVHHLTGNWKFLVMMLVPVTLIYLTHKFTLQALTAVNLGVLVLTRDPSYLLVQAAGLPLAVALSGGFYVKVLRGHLAFLNYYRVKGARKYPGKYGLHRERLMKVLKLDATGDPWMYLLVPMLWLGGWPPDLMTGVALTMALAYLLVSLNPLLFLGEPERYFETAAFPLAVAVPIFLLSSPSWAWALFAALLVLGASRIVREMRGREELMASATRLIEHHVDPEWLQACEFIKKHPGRRVLTVSEYLQWGTAYFTGKPTQGTESAREYGNYMDEFPATPANLRSLVRKYDVDLVLVARAASEGFDLSWAKKVFENGRYDVYEAG